MHYRTHNNWLDYVFYEIRYWIDHTYVSRHHMCLFELGQTFRRARIAANRTQQQIAERSGVSRARISRFESGVLIEIGAVKLLRLFEAVGLELYARPFGHGRTLDDILQEQQATPVSAHELRKRVRLSRATRDG